MLRGVVVPPPQLLSTFMRPDFNVGQNLRLAARLFGIPRRVVRTRSDAILDFAGMHAKTPVDPRGAGDVFRRLGMAIAIGAAPDVLLLDEVPRRRRRGVRHALRRGARPRCPPAGRRSCSPPAPSTRSRCSARRSCFCATGCLVEHERSTDHVEAPRRARGGGTGRGVAGARHHRRDDGAPRAPARAAGPTGSCRSGKPGWPGIGFHQWAGLLSVHVRDATGAEVTRIAPQDELVVEFGIETGVRGLQIHWCVSFLAEDGADISVEEDAPRRYGARTVSTVTVSIAPGHAASRAPSSGASTG